MYCFSMYCLRLRIERVLLRRIDVTVEGRERGVGKLGWW